MINIAMNICIMRPSEMFLMPNFAPKLDPKKVMINNVRMNKICSNKLFLWSSERTIKCDKTAIGTTIIMILRLEPIDILVFNLPKVCSVGT